MIKVSAIKFYLEDDTDKEFPQIMTGRRHADIISRMNLLGIFYNPRWIEGFLTDEDRFLNRFQARAHALRCHQISQETFEESGRYGGLYSEDIWPE